MTSLPVKGGRAHYRDKVRNLLFVDVCHLIVGLFIGILCADFLATLIKCPPAITKSKQIPGEEDKQNIQKDGDRMARLVNHFLGSQCCVFRKS